MKFLNTRRQMLLGLAAASTAAATGAPASEGRTPENPELLSLGNSTDALHRTYEAARAECLRIAREVAPRWPLAPEEILSFSNGCIEETDVTGTPIKRAVEGRGKLEQFWSYGTPEYFAAMIQHHKKRVAHIMATKSKRGLKSEEAWLKRSEKALPLSRAYTAETERLRHQSGYEPAKERLEAASIALRDHVNQIMAANAVTMEGVVIKAQALKAWSRVETLHKILSDRGERWAEELANAIIGQARANA